MSINAQVMTNTINFNNNNIMEKIKKAKFHKILRVTPNGNITWYDVFMPKIMLCEQRKIMDSIPKWGRM